MAYRNTLQADALKLVVKKLQSSLAVEGELPEDGPAAYGDAGDDLMLTLARKIVAGEEDADPVESVFAQARQVAAEWRAPEPVAVPVLADQPHGGGQPNEAPEPQQSVFSWAEFLAEKPAEPGRRRRKSPASLPLFELAVSLERGQQREVVGAEG